MFIIFSLGGIGGMVFMFIVNVLEVVILGVFKFEMKFKWNGKEFELCLMVLLSLLYDYWVIDGVVGVRFFIEVVVNLIDLCRIIF